MSEPILFSFSGTPVGKGRPRATVRGGFATIYTPSKTRKYELAVAKVARIAMGSQRPLEGPLSVSMRFRLPIPKSMTKRLQRAVLAGEEAYMGAFDLDNLIKAVLDPCNAICFHDDKQVVRLFATKLASERPGVDIRIEALQPQSSEEICAELTRHG